MKTGTVEIEDLEPQLREPVNKLIDLSNQRYDVTDWHEDRVKADDISKEKFGDILESMDCLPDGCFLGIPSFDLEYSMTDYVHTPDENPPGVDRAYAVKVFANNWHVATLTVFAMGHDYGGDIEFSTWKLRRVRTHI